MADHSVPMAKQVGQVIKEARLAVNLTQEKLAEEIGVEDRTIRKWESGEVVPNFSNRSGLVHLLSIQPELLFLQEKTDYSLEKAQLLVRRIGLFLDSGAFVSALGNADLLVSNLTRQIKRGEIDLLLSLNYVRYLRGHALSIVQDDAHLALNDFKRMGRQASKLGDENLRCTALTYQGEMYRRMCNYDEAIRILKKAPRGPNVDNMVIGNSQQLLARAYIARNNREAAMRVMGEAEERASGGQGHSSNLYVCFNSCSVYLDYAKIFLKSGNARKSLYYIEKAEKLEESGTIGPRWSVPIRLVKGEVFLSMIADIGTRDSKSILQDPCYEAGRDLLLEGYSLAKEYGHQRQVQRARKLVNNFEQRAANSSRIAQDLGERLYTYDKNNHQQ